MGYLLYAIVWFLFAISHSVLAQPAIQERIEIVVKRYYRFLYNSLSAISIFLVFYIGRIGLSNDIFPIFDNAFTTSASMATRIVGVIVLLVAFASYDIGRFLGITQIMKGEKISSSSNEPLNTNGMNRWVRHPLYTGAFLYLWGGATSSFGFWTAIWGTLYLVIGTHFEERKLVKIYQDDYRQYQKSVPKYFPRIVN